MWASHVDQTRLQRMNTEQNNWHRGDQQPASERLHEAHPTEEIEDDESRDGAGTWGERDVGGFNESEAVQTLEALRSDLRDLERTRSNNTQASLKRTVSRRSQAARPALSRPQTAQSERPATQRTESVGEEDVEAQGGALEEEEEFELDQFMREGHFEKRSDDRSHKKVGVIWNNLTIKGVGSTASFVKTLPDAILGTFGPDLYRNISRFVPALAHRNGETRTLINNFDGCVRDGEMMLVLGRPGAGCSTFLKAISNNRETYASVDGEVSYGGIAADKQKKMYRGEVNYNGEDDVHFASLNVWQTFRFALMNKTKKKASDEIGVVANALLRMFGISHTKYTLVGDEYTRGVSGGERKRVSIAETLASKAAVIAWDNSTRGKCKA